MYKKYICQVCEREFNETEIKQWRGLPNGDINPEPACPNCGSSNLILNDLEIIALPNEDKVIADNIRDYWKHLGVAD